MLVDPVDEQAPVVREAVAADELVVDASRALGQLHLALLISGDARELAALQLYQFEAYEKGQNLHMNAEVRRRELMRLANVKL